MWVSVAVVAILLAAAASNTMRQEKPGLPDGSGSESAGAAGSGVGRRSLNRMPVLVKNETHICQKWKEVIMCQEISQIAGIPVPGGQDSYRTDGNSATPPMSGCRPESAMSASCNVCICGASGTWACTKRKCLRKKRDATCSSEEMENPQTKCACVQKGYGTPEDQAQCLEDKYELGPERLKRSAAGERVCEPGITFMDWCNQCRCNIQGTGAACTKKKCYKTCRPGTLKFLIDGICLCHGGTWKCCRGDNTATRCHMYDIEEDTSICFPEDLTCNHRRMKRATEVEPANESTEVGQVKRATAVELTKQSTEVQQMKRSAAVEQVCQPGTTFMKDCNTCRCNSQGTKADCTVKKCYQSGRFKRHEHMETDNQPTVCLEKQKKLKNCNTCRDLPPRPTPAPSIPGVTTTLAPPTQPICIHPEKHTKNCNTCRVKDQRTSNRNVRQILDKQIHVPPIPPHRTPPSTHPPDGDFPIYHSHKQIHIPPIPPHRAPPSTHPPDTDFPIYRSDKQIHIPPIPPHRHPPNTDFPIYGNEKQIHIPPIPPHRSPPSNHPPETDFPIYRNDKQIHIPPIPPHRPPPSAHPSDTDFPIYHSDKQIHILPIPPHRPPPSTHPSDTHFPIYRNDKQIHIPPIPPHQPPPSTHPPDTDFHIYRNDKQIHIPPIPPHRSPSSTHPPDTDFPIYHSDKQIHIPPIPPYRPPPSTHPPDTDFPIYRSDK